jgi:hypothetical protein
MKEKHVLESTIDTEVTRIYYRCCQADAKAPPRMTSDHQPNTSCLNSYLDLHEQALAQNRLEQKSRFIVDRVCACVGE